MSVDNGVTFGNFGKSFQEKILQALMCDHQWAAQMMEVVKVDYFDVSYLKYLFSIFSRYHAQYRCFPTLQLLVTMARDELKEGNDEIMCHQIVEYITRVRSNPNINDLPYVKDKSLNFCKNQALKDALEHAVDLVQEERYETIVDVVKEAITVGTPNTTGMDFFEDIEKRYRLEDRHVIPTGIPQLDSKEIMNGGLGKGEIGVIIAPTGVGKSHWLVNLGANAMRAGKNVLYYTFELREEKVGLRFDSNFCRVSTTDILEEKEFVDETYKGFEGKLGRLIIKEYPTNSASVLTIRSHIEKLAITKSFVPDLLIVDYADIMRSTRQYDSLRHELKLVYEELRGLGMELGIPVWTASQSNRESTDSDIVGLDKISESYGKAMVCDFIVSLSRKPLQKSNGLGNLFIPKNRLGKDGILFPVKVNTAMSVIEVLDKNIDLEEFQRTNNNEMKQIIKNKWKEVTDERFIELRDGAEKKVVNDSGNE